MLGTKSLNSKEKDHMYLFHGFISNLSLGMASGNISLPLIYYNQIQKFSKTLYYNRLGRRFMFQNSSFIFPSF